MLEYLATLGLQLLEEYVPNLAILLLFTAGVVGLLVLYVAFRLGWSAEKFKAHWRTTGDGAPAGIVMAIVVVILLTFGAFMANRVQAAEVEWFKYTTVYAGLEANRMVSPFCHANPVDDRIASNVGFTQHIVRVWSIDLLLPYTHHSCAVGQDDAGYDALGLRLEWRFDRR